MPKDDKNKKPKRAYNKKKTEVMGLSALTPEDKKYLPIKQLEQVEDVIKQAFLRFHDNAVLKQYKMQDLEHLDVLASEYLGTFMILGYDMNGEKVFIMHAKTPHERDALVEHLRTTLLGIINSQG